MMNFSSLLVSCLAFLVVLTVAAEQSNDDSGEYITWNDLTVSAGDRKFEYGLRTDGMKIEKRVITVNKNGGGDSVTVQGAVDMVPENNADRVKIHILPGIYSEKVHIPASKPYISFIGDPNQASATVITWHDKASDRQQNGSVVGTQNSASVTVESNYFCASGITIENPVEGTSQAVALRTTSDKNVFYKTRFLGAQDTLLDETGTHYFLQCFIQGSVDFIFGYAKSLYQECTISVVPNQYAVTAHGRGSAEEDTGFSFVNCVVTGTGPVYLGRAWGDYSRVIFSSTEFDIDIFPEGWSDWGVSSRHNTVVFGEYGCKGRGADRTGRVRWSKGLSYEEAKPYLDTSFISGELWLRL